MMIDERIKLITKNSDKNMDFVIELIKTLKSDNSKAVQKTNKK